MQVQPEPVPKPREKWHRSAERSEARAVVTRVHREAAVKKIFGESAPAAVRVWAESSQGCLQVRLGTGAEVDLYAVAQELAARER